MDGAGFFTTLFRVVLPMSWPTLSAFVLITVVNEWNQYLWPFLITDTPAAATLPVGLTRLQDAEGVTNWAPVMAGTVLTMLTAMVLIPTGHLVWAAVLSLLFAAFDMVDGTMARMRGGGTKFGATLDATCDRIGDGAVFGGLVLYFAADGDSQLYLSLSLYCLVMGSVTSYARARAEGLGYQAKVGVAERADRLVAILMGGE